MGISSFFPFRLDFFKYHPNALELKSAQVSRLSSFFFLFYFIEPSKFVSMFSHETACVFDNHFLFLFAFLFASSFFFFGRKFHMHWKQSFFWGQIESIAVGTFDIIIIIVIHEHGVFDFSTRMKEKWREEVKKKRLWIGSVFISANDDNEIERKKQQQIAKAWILSQKPILSHSKNMDQNGLNIRPTNQLILYRVR